MSSVECLREFVYERLTAAAEEIFRVFKKSIVEYQEELDRQRRLLDMFLTPEIKLHRIEFPLQRVNKEEEVLADQQLCNLEMSSSLNQEEPKLPQIKEEQEELCTSQKGEQLVLKLETDTFMLSPTYEESDSSEPKPKSISSTINSFVAESRDQKGSKHGDSGSTRNAELKPQDQHHKSKSHNNNAYNSNLSEIHCNTGKKSFKCDTCGKAFRYKSQLCLHLRVHTGERPYACKTCGKSFRDMTALKGHMRIHTGEKPYSCTTCGKGFRFGSGLFVHMRIHTGEKPYLCKTCGKRFRHMQAFKGHMTTHTDERPYSCDTCGKRFCRTSVLTDHIRIHTGEKPYLCKTCGRHFRCSSALSVHMKTHTGQ